MISVVLSLGYTLASLAFVFVLTFVAGVWVVAQIFEDGKGPPGQVVIAVLVAVSAITAYAVVIQGSGSRSECVEYTPQGSGHC